MSNVEGLPQSIVEKFKSFTLDEQDEQPVYIAPSPRIPYEVRGPEVTYKGFVRNEPELAEKKLKMYHAWFANRQKLSSNVSTSNGQDQFSNDKRSSLNSSFEKSPIKLKRIPSQNDEPDVV